MPPAPEAADAAPAAPAADALASDSDADPPSDADSDKEDGDDDANAAAITTAAAPAAPADLLFVARDQPHLDALLCLVEQHAVMKRTHVEIRIRDNGSGVEQDDLPLTIARHATPAGPVGRLCRNADHEGERNGLHVIWNYVSLVGDGEIAILF